MSQNHAGAATPIDRYALSAAMATAVTWGFTGIFVRLLPPLSPVTVTAGRLVVATVVAIPFAWRLWRRKRGTAAALGDSAAWLLSLLLVGYYLLATSAFQLAPVGEVALLLSTPPLFVLGYRRLRGIATGRRELFGALSAIGGIAVIVLPGLAAGSGRPGHGTGDALALAAAALTASYASWFRALDQRGTAPEPLGVALRTFALGGVFLSILAGALPAASAANLWEASTLVLFIGLGVLSTALPTVSFAVASRRLPAVVTTTVNLLIPVFAALFAYLVLAERPSPTLLPGSILVLGGLLLILRQRR